ncbi:MAG: ABC transporter permease [Acidimicrobiia bacterium]
MADRPGIAGLAFRQLRYENKVFWRTPIAAFFTVFFPLMFLVLFSALFGNEVIEIPGRGSFSVAQFYAPALAAFAAGSATYTNIGVGIAFARDQGILKRFRGAPLPAPAFMIGKIGSGIWIAFLASSLMLAVGVVAYDVSIDLERMPAALITFLLGAGSFAGLGLALGSLAPTGEGSPAIANATYLPLAFASDVFIAVGDPPAVLDFIGKVFPLKHFVNAFQDAFNPLTTDLAFRPGSWAVMAAWGVFGALIAWRFFRWQPRHRTRKSRRERRAEAG